MTMNRQAMCRQRGHAWMPWGLWEPLQPRTAPTFVAEADAKPIASPIPKHRFRQCERCGAYQAENGAGEISEPSHD